MQFLMFLIYNGCCHTAGVRESIRSSNLTWLFQLPGCILFAWKIKAGICYLHVSVIYVIFGQLDILKSCTLPPSQNLLKCLRCILICDSYGFCSEDSVAACWILLLWLLDLLLGFGVWTTKCTDKIVCPCRDESVQDVKPWPQWKPGHTLYL